MFKLEPGKSQLWFSHGAAIDKQWEKLLRRTSDHPFNHSVEVFVPGRARLPSRLRSIKPPTYFTSQLHLSEFVDPLQRHTLSSGSICGLSLHTRVDTDCVYALLPSGNLVLSVDKDTYERLGLVGKASRYQKHHRFIVEVDLLAEHFQPGKPNYERVRRCLEERLNDSVQFVLTAEEFRESKELLKTVHQCKVEKGLLHNFKLPTINSENPRGEEPSACCSVTDFHTWHGTVSCGMDMNGETPDNEYVSTYKIPEPHTTCQYGARVRWSGMIHSNWIREILRRSRCVLDSVIGEKEDSAVPWIAVSVWGFEDSPVSWGNCEHGSFMWGDNHYMVILFRDEHYWTVTSLGSHDSIC